VPKVTEIQRVLGKELEFLNMPFAIICTPKAIEWTDDNTVDKSPEWADAKRDSKVSKAQAASGLRAQPVYIFSCSCLVLTRASMPL